MGPTYYAKELEIFLKKTCWGQNFPYNWTWMSNLLEPRSLSWLWLVTKVSPSAGRSYYTQMLHLAEDVIIITFFILIYLGSLTFIISDTILVILISLLKLQLSQCDKRHRHSNKTFKKFIYPGGYNWTRCHIQLRENVLVLM